MLSICIPVYNFDIRSLVAELNRQAVLCNVAFEILIMDDASDSSYLSCLQEAATLPHVRLIMLSKNIGRSKIRNAMVQEAQYPYIIFMDCDSATVSNNYIATYLTYCQPNTVVYGGRKYKNEKPSDASLLHWKYGVKRESLLASERNRNPNFSFCTNNFLIDKGVFDIVSFNEQLEGYGHEDTFFGLELLGQHISIIHIDNPLIHLGLETAEVFLKKTENGIFNLHKIEMILREKFPDYVGHSKLMRTKIFLQKWNLFFVSKLLLNFLKPLLTRNLLSRHPSLFVFDLYKLLNLLKYN